MIVAQSFLEYGAMGSLIGELQRLASLAQLSIRNAGPETWLVISAIVLVTIWLFGHLPWSRQ